jgi:tetratricopeptide (TPR) repeat protein
MQRGRFVVALGAVLVAALVLRLGYVLAQPASDPAFAHPLLDGGYYLTWARSIASGSGGVPGAFYLAPLFPYLLAAILGAFGERFTLIYLVQHLFVLGAAAALAIASRRIAGDIAGLGAAALFVFYHPSVFFASSPIGEPLALLLIAAAVAAAGVDSRGGAWWGGVAAGAAALARPNFLLVAVPWAIGAAMRHRLARAVLLVGGIALAIAPVALRNLASSGHLVLVSSNGGMTLYHGNGPGALGIYAPAPGFSGDLSTQRDEATRRAKLLSGNDLDPVEADLWWGRQAVRSRAQDPVGTIRLLGRRVLLTLDNHEHSVDYAPALDENPWRRAAPVPFAAILGLAVAGVILAGAKGTGGWPVWGAIAAAASTPVLFYVSSRYRLPLAALLCIPAGAGLAALFDTSLPQSRRRLPVAIVAGGLSAAISLSVPFADLRIAERAAALANRAGSWKKAGDLPSGERDARLALRLDPAQRVARLNLAAIQTAAGRTGDAEASYREVLRIYPADPGASENLSSILVLRGAQAEAIGLLRAAIDADPGATGCWNNLIVALMSSGDLTGARAEAARAESSGVTLDPALRERLAVEPARVATP